MPQIFNELEFHDSNVKLSICMYIMKGNAGLYSILNKCNTLAAEELQSSDYMDNAYAEHKMTLGQMIKENIIVVSLAILVIIALMLLTRKAQKAERVARELNEELAQTLPQAAARIEKGIPGRPGTIAIASSILTGKRVLLAEDNDLNAEIAIEILSQYDITAERAADGVIAVDMLQKKPAGYYDMILMDVQMPNMDGYKATQAIRRMADAGKNNIPILAMTANDSEEDRQNALKAGMNGHLAKPIDIAKLVGYMIKLLQKNK